MFGISVTMAITRSQTLSGLHPFLPAASAKRGNRWQYHSREVRNQLLL